MSHPSFEKWRSMSKGVIPTRFESSLGRFRSLSEAKKFRFPRPSTKLDRRVTKRDRRPGSHEHRVEVDTIDTVSNNPNTLNMAQSVEDPREIEKERVDERCRQLKFVRERLNTLKWIKKQARRDFNMVGGTTASGAMGGAGGMDGQRPVSLGART